MYHLRIVFDINFVSPDENNMACDFDFHNRSEYDAFLLGLEVARDHSAEFDYVIIEDSESDK